MVKFLLSAGFVWFLIEGKKYIEKQCIELLKCLFLLLIFELDAFKWKINGEKMQTHNTKWRPDKIWEGHRDKNDVLTLEKQKKEKKLQDDTIYNGCAWLIPRVYVASLYHSFDQMICLLKLGGAIESWDVTKGFIVDAFIRCVHTKSSASCARANE